MNILLSYYIIQDGYVSFEDFKHFMVNYDDEDYGEERENFLLTEDCEKHPMNEDPDLDEAREEMITK